jgi:hypothetical protein
VGGQKLDGGDRPGLLGWKDGLKDQWWDLAINVTGSGGVGIQAVTATIEIGGNG